ncbi:hypothetical protein Pyn_23107 [Prunus yedoensis var. nudiflora]|uniref:Uncharacterized protein n=1 Tax=Prunus yedoensis var. nudiflora TaxID=2094558 RepID=A0A314Y637_PRUYE|nr:hypothetical protein Pyn_23107 [Prunus yedoensis var. nudiflora]
MPDLNIPAPSTPMVEGRSSSVVETAQHPFCLGDGASPTNFLQRSFQTTLIPYRWVPVLLLILPCWPPQEYS